MTLFYPHSWGLMVAITRENHTLWWVREKWELIWEVFHGKIVRISKLINVYGGTTCGISWEEHGDIMIQRHDGNFSWECNGDIIGFFNKPSEYPLVN